MLRNAFADLLFGIHNQTPMDFRFGYAGMRISADIIRPDEPQTTFSRRKARGNVVTGADDQRWTRDFCMACSAAATANCWSGCSFWIPKDCAGAAPTCWNQAATSPAHCSPPPAEFGRPAR